MLLNVGFQSSGDESLHQRVAVEIVEPTNFFVPSFNESWTVKSRVDSSCVDYEL